MNKQTIFASNGHFQICLHPIALFYGFFSGMALILFGLLIKFVQQICLPNGLVEVDAALPIAGHKNEAEFRAEQSKREAQFMIAQEKWRADPENVQKQWEAEFRAEQAKRETEFKFAQAKKKAEWEADPETAQKQWEAEFKTEQEKREAEFKFAQAKKEEEFKSKQRNGTNGKQNKIVHRTTNWSNRPKLFAKKMSILQFID